MFDLDLNITNGTVSNILTAKKLREILKSWKKDHNNIFFTLMLYMYYMKRSLKSEWPRCSFFYILNNVPWSPVTRFHVGWLLTGGKNSSVVLVCHPVTERTKINTVCSFYQTPLSAFLDSNYQYSMYTVIIFFFSSLFMSNEHFFMIAKIFVVWMWFSTEF